MGRVINFRPRVSSIKQQTIEYSCLDEDEVLNIDANTFTIVSFMGICADLLATPEMSADERLILREELRKLKDKLSGLEMSLIKWEDENGL
jgi:hypothetical protein